MPTIVIRATIIYIVLTLMIRVSGKRQVGQLDITDFVTTILLSEIACLPIDDPDVPLLYAITPISVIVCIEIILTFIKNKSSFLKKSCFHPLSKYEKNSFADKVNRKLMNSFQNKTLFR